MTASEQQDIFNSWLHQYEGIFFKIINVYASNLEDRDDLFQEISFQVWKSVARFEGKSAVSTWIYRIALNTAMKWSQRHQKHSRSHEPLENVSHILKENKSVDPRLAWLYEEIAGFSEIDRSLTLLMLDGFSYKEMASMLGMTESNVGVKINRIKKKLIKNSKEYDYHGV